MRYTNKNRGRNIAVALLWAVGTAALSPAAEAYNISAKGHIHERLTRLAELCLQSQRNVTRCALPGNKKAFDAVDWRNAEFWKAVQWPDDPTDQGNLRGGIKLAINAGFGRCNHYLGTSKPFAGLLCNSHFGKFQFFHAMASTPEETPAQTRALILAWTHFAFRVAAQKISDAAPYCAAIRSQGSLLAEHFAPASFPFCEDRPNGKGVFPAWTVRTLFVMHCRNLFSSVTCTEETGNAADDKAAKNATGALLHLIQDSYSQSHTSRSEWKPTGPYQPIVDCAPVQKFYLYAANEKNHAQADKAPTFATNCALDQTIIDPVTASARMLMYIRDAKMGDVDAEDKAVAMMQNAVIG